MNKDKLLEKFRKRINDIVIERAEESNQSKRDRLSNIITGIDICMDIVRAEKE